VAVHATPPGSGEVGCSTKLVAGEAGVTVNATGVPVGHSSLNAVPVTFTCSLKLIVTVVFGGTVVAPLAGDVEETDAGRSVVNVKPSFGVLFWPVSVSARWPAALVAVQATPLGRLAVGCSTKLVAGEAGVTVNASGVPVGHSSLNAVPVTFTCSLKLIV